MGLSLPIWKCQKILNWHKSTNTINNAVPMTVIIDILLLKRVKLLTHSFYIGPTIVSFLGLLIHFFLSLQVFIQTSSAESLTGRLTRLAAECQRFLMSALLNLLCPASLLITLCFN